MANRAGRPRVQTERFPSGKAKDRPVGPTPEQQRRKHFLIGDSPRGDAESPMGVLVAHGLVDQQVRDTITNPYMRAKKKVFGSYGPAMPGDGTERGHDSSGSDAAERAARQVIAACDKVLDTLRNRRARDLFDNFVVRERWPTYMQQCPGQHRLVLARRDGESRPTHIGDLELVVLLEILEQLAIEFKIRKRPDKSPMVAMQAERHPTVGRNFQQSAGE